MRLLIRTSAIALALATAGCSLGGLLGGGKPPTTLVTLTPEAAEPASLARTAAAGQAVTIETPAVSHELSNVRVPVQVTPTDVQYVANLQLVDTPAKLFQGLLAETVRRSIRV
jgi:cholesterol transport system auxiliary component